MLTRSLFAIATSLSLCCNQEVDLFDKSAPRVGPPLKHISQQAVELPFQVTGSIDTREFPSSSGIVYHPTRKSLFVVNDDGYIGELETDGRLVKSRHIINDDFEGITVDPATGLLYVVIEGRDDILEIDPDDLSLRRDFDIDREFKGVRLFEKGGEGIEGITFVANRSLPEGGTFFLVNRSSHPKDLDDGPLILEVQLPLTSTSTEKLEGKIQSYTRLQVTELSGLHHDRAMDRLWATVDRHNVVIQLNRKGDLLNAYQLPAEDPEGITFDDEGFMYIARDSDEGILILKPNDRP